MEFTLNVKKSSDDGMKCGSRSSNPRFSEKLHPVFWDSEPTSNTGRKLYEDVDFKCLGDASVDYVMIRGNFNFQITGSTKYVG